MTKRYAVTFTGRLEIEAETEQQAIQDFWKVIVEMMSADDVTDVSAKEEE